MLTMTEYITRHDDIMTIVQVVDDPIYLDEPYVLSITYSYDPNAGPATENCTGSSFAENGGTRSPSRAAFPAGTEQRHRRVPEDGELDSVRAGARRRQDDLSGIPRRSWPARRRSTASPSRCRSPRTTSRSALPIRARATDRCTCCRCRATSTCWSPTARTSPRRSAGTALPSSTPARRRCRTRCSRR